MEKDLYKEYLRLSDKIVNEGAESLNDQERALVINVRKKDNENVLSKIKQKPSYFICDRSGASTKVEPTEFDEISVYVRRVGSEEIEVIGIEEYHSHFNEFEKDAVSVVVRSRVFVDYWDEEKDFMEKIEKEEYIVKQNYKFGEITCVYKSTIEKA